MPQPARSRSHRARAPWSGPGSRSRCARASRARSGRAPGLALKHGVTVLNAPGTIDSDYRGEIGVLLVNLGESAFVVERGMRIAQLVIAPVARARLVEGEIGPTGRGADGFGSTGLGLEGEDGSRT